MPNQEIEINFSFSFGELLNQVIEKQTYLERDQPVLAPRGITPERLAAFAVLRSTFQDQTPDVVFRSRVKAAVAVRDATREVLTIKLRDLAGVAGSALGERSAEYDSFDYAKVGASDPANFVQLAENMADRAGDFEAQLTPYGITEDDIALIRADIATIQADMSAVATARANRDVATQARRRAANALYTELAAMADVAKVYFQDRDEALYNDYIIYSSSATAQTRTGRLKALQTKTRELEAMTADTQIIVKNEGEGTLQAYFSQHIDGSPAPEGAEGVFATILSHQTLTLLAGENLGYNPDIDAKHFTLRNASEDKMVIYRARIE